MKVRVVAKPFYLDNYLMPEAREYEDHLKAMRLLHNLKKLRINKFKGQCCVLLTRDNLIYEKKYPYEIFGLASVEAPVIVVHGFDVTNPNYGNNIFFVTLHELGHICDIFPKERKGSVETSKDGCIHCANTCVMHASKPISRRMLSGKPFCDVCLYYLNKCTEKTKKDLK
ncbi:MAG: hypothetical protein Q8O88_03055 [bacterium]|nr:hypothetical protein [bacterium]